MTDCICPIAQHCERHGRQMSTIHWNKCQAGHSDALATMYHTAKEPQWPQGKSRGKETQNMPGNVLHSLLRQRYGANVASCKCQEWIDRMNDWGPVGCVEHFEEIVDHLFEEASTNAQVSVMIRSALKVPIIGAMEGRRQLGNLLTEAIAMAESAPNKSMTTEALEVRLQTPANNWPKGWRDWPNVIEYHRNLLLRRLAEVSNESTPDTGSDRAILIPAGGRCTIYDRTAPQLYFWQAFAAAWTLRAVGCTLPIEFWFLPGEMEEIEHAELYARRVAATCHVVNTSGMRCVHGWQIKINAILQTKYREVIHMDADNIATKDPEYLFDSETYRDNAAMFWMDNPHVNDFHGRIIEDQWQRVGLKRRDRINDIETGQMVIDKRRAWTALQICKHFADRADYWEGFNGGERGVWYGDKTSFHMACKLTETPHHIQPWNKWNAGGFYEHCDPSGEVLFQHACHRKGHLNNGHAIPNLRGNQHIIEAAAFKSPLQFLDGTIEDAVKLIAPEKHFAIEPDRISREVWMDVVSRNEYLLAPTIPDEATVIDIGANSGAFAYACLRRGAGKVVAFEPGPVAEMCRANCDEFGDRCEVRQAAVWRSDEAPRTISLATSHREKHSGSISAVLKPTGPTIECSTVALDDILRDCGIVHILKIDCEGSEYPILYTSSELRRVEHILGEYHHGADRTKAGNTATQPDWNLDGLTWYLETQGFEVYRTIAHGPTHGNFWARKKAPS